MMKVILRAIAAFTGFFGLGLQLWLMIGYPGGRDMVWPITKFFSYFTILANCFAALAMLLPLVAPSCGWGRFVLRPTVRTAIAAYMIIVGAFYFLYLRHIGNDQGLERLADQLMHYVAPVLFVVDWLVFVPKGELPWTIIGSSLGVPILYGIWTLLHGALTHWYPYPFINATKLGPQQTAVNLVGFLAAFTVVALTLFVIDWAFGLLQRHSDRDRR